MSPVTQVPQMINPALLAQLEQMGRAREGQGASAEVAPDQTTPQTLPTVAVDAATVNKYRAFCQALLAKTGKDLNIDTLKESEIYDLEFEGVEDHFHAKRCLRVYVGARETGFDKLPKRDAELFLKYAEASRLDSNAKEFGLSIDGSMESITVHSGNQSGQQLKNALSGFTQKADAPGAQELQTRLNDRLGAPYATLAYHIPEAAAIIAPAAQRIADARKAHDEALKAYQEEEKKYNEAASSLGQVNIDRLAYYRDSLLKIPGVDKVQITLGELQTDGSRVEKTLPLSEYISSTMQKVERGEMSLKDAVNRIETFSNAAHSVFFGQFKTEQEVEEFKKNPENAALFAAHEGFDKEFAALVDNEPKEQSGAAAPSREALDAALKKYNDAHGAYAQAVAGLDKVDSDLLEAAESNLVLRYALESQRYVKDANGEDVVVVDIPNEEFATYHYRARQHYLAEFKEDAQILEDEIKKMEGAVPQEILQYLNDSIVNGKEAIVTNQFEKQAIDMKQLNEMIRTAKLDKNTAEELRLAARSIERLYGARQISGEPAPVWNVERMAYKFYERREDALQRGALKPEQADTGTMFVGTWKQGRDAGFSELDKFQEGAANDGRSPLHGIAQSWERQFALTTGIDRRRWSYFERPFVALGKENIGTIFRNVVIPQGIGSFIPGYRIDLFRTGGRGVIGGGGNGSGSGY